MRRTFTSQIDMGRTLTTTRDKNCVLGRFLAWATGHGYESPITPNVVELRWNDDFTLLWVSKLSGLIERGFTTARREHQPIIDEEKFSIYSDANPAACALLAAIRDLMSLHKLEKEGDHGPVWEALVDLIIPYAFCFATDHCAFLPNASDTK